MSNRRTAGLVGGVVGVVALGAAVGLAAERRAIGRTRSGPDPARDEPFFHLPADRTRRLVAGDGVPLHVEEVGQGKATVVFCHGYTNQLAVWHYQRQALEREGLGKLIFWDQRSHGRSGRSPAHHSTIDQLGRDLMTVLDTCAPTGPVVLVGHSMGGMTIMALAAQRPDLFGPRIKGVALIATSPGRLAEVTFGLPAAMTRVTKRVMPYLTRSMRGRPEVFESGRRLGTDLAFVASRRAAFGSQDVSPSLVEFVEKMTADTPVDVIAEFYDTFLDHDRLAALPVLDGIETLVLAGTLDKITPVGHSRDIAAAVPRARLVVVEGAGHMVMLERPEVVTLQLRALVRKALA